ncbi:hypothetical protein [Saccharomonospora xinjiangensis]|uniref:Uncharacterized protein n=1 Tax=Saccharomonospora xinjiangensis XJ-54 TaxID=882086 RepID=I0UY87_9PSEU|nr:hypothetical protein [Saccharomonospora xinjiangensis]EID52840.1 hypothetical protein SacxiDRAFT_0567 [Saccharomonospora xinjiangensis XJ-54]
MRLRRNWPYLALLVLVALPLLWIAGALAARSGMFVFEGTVAPEQVQVFLTFVGGGLATAATVFGALLTREHNARERRRLRLDNVLRGLESMPEEASVQSRVAGILSTMVLLGQERVALRVLEPAWQSGNVDAATATWCIGQIITGEGAERDYLEGDRTDPTAVNEAAVLLREHSDKLVDSHGYYFPGHFLHEWTTKQPLPLKVKDNILRSIGTMLRCHDRRWWFPDGRIPIWPTEVLMKCVERDSSTSVQASAALLVGSLYEVNPEEFRRAYGVRRTDSMLARAQDEPLSEDYVDISAELRTAWSDPEPSDHTASHRPHRPRHRRKKP